MVRCCGEKNSRQTQIPRVQRKTNKDKDWHGCKRLPKSQAENVEGSERKNPLQVYDLYSSKRPQDIKDPESPFYLAINRTKPWFKSAPMGINKLGFLMKTMARKVMNH